MNAVTAPGARLALLAATLVVMDLAALRHPPVPGVVGWLATGAFVAFTAPPCDGSCRGAWRASMALLEQVY
jgi:hypothetical protein